MKTVAPTLRVGFYISVNNKTTPYRPTGKPDVDNPLIEELFLVILNFGI